MIMMMTLICCVYYIVTQLSLYCYVTDIYTLKVDTELVNIQLSERMASQLREVHSVKQDNTATLELWPSSSGQHINTRYHKHEHPLEHATEHPLVTSSNISPTSDNPLEHTTERWNDVGTCHWISIGTCEWQSTIIPEVLISGVQCSAPTSQLLQMRASCVCQVCRMSLRDHTARPHPL